MPVHPVLRKDLQDQLHELSTRSIIFPAERPPRVRQPQCYLTWSKEKEGSKAVTLGPYARWLIAADLLMLGSGYEKLHDELASCISESTGDDSKFAAVDRVFINNGVRSDRRYVEAWRYGMSSHVEYGRPVLKALRKRIEQKYLASRGCGFSKQEFLTVPVPINPFSTTLGYEPIAWFRNWIRWNVGVPYSDPRDRALHDAVDPADRALLNEVVTVLGNATQLEHQRIINVAASDLRGSTSSFAAAISHALANHKNADGHDDSIPVVRVRLAIRATRQSVVHDLYNAFQFSDGVSKGSIDLSTDIQPLRKALTTNKVVVIFEAYDNVRGAFHTLNEFLNHTHWPELLRVLAQPDPTVWTTTPTNERPPLQYALVVLSTRRTQQLWPWVYPLPDPDDANAREQTPNVDTNA